QRGHHHDVEGNEEEQRRHGQEGVDADPRRRQTRRLRALRPRLRVLACVDAGRLHAAGAHGDAVAAHSPASARSLRRQPTMPTMESRTMMGTSIMVAAAMPWPTFWLEVIMSIT